MDFSDLPLELLIQILSLALHSHQTPTDILLVNSLFFRISQPILHTHLYFPSSLRLKRFSDSSLNLACTPQTLTLALAGGVADYQLFAHLRDALLRCNASRPIDPIAEKGRIVLDLLRLRLNSHTRDPNLGLIFEALSLANPRRFIWTGPDPPHHFSTAIVPSATTHLFRALSTYTHLHHLKLTNIAFEPPGSAPNSPLFVFPSLPSLRTIYLGQATFLSPSCIATLCLPNEDSGSSTQLEEIRLVDAYKESIWGFRIRRSDIEAAAIALVVGDGELVNDGELVSDGELVDVIECIRRLVICEAQTERIMGGDRVESGTLVLH